MRYLLAHVRRGALRMPFRLLAVSLVAAIGFAMYAGVYSAIDNLTGKRALEYSRGNIADLDVRFAPEDKTLLPDLSRVEGVSGVESRLIYPGRLQLTDQTLLSLLITVDPAAGGRINKITLLEGKDLDENDPSGVMIDRNLARYRGIRVGDEIELSLADEVYHLHVAGIGMSPEFLLAPSNPSVFVPAKGSLGILFATPKLIEQKLGIPLVNSLLVKYRPGASPGEIRQRVVDQAGAAVHVDFSLPLSDQFGFRFLDLNLHAFRVFLPALVVVFGLTAFLVTQFLMFQWISQERQQIGAQMALGYSKPVIALAYLFPTLVIAGVALVFGILLSYFAAFTFAKNLADSMGFPYPETHVAGVRIIHGFLGVLVVLSAAAAGPLGWLLRLRPLEAVRETRGVSGGGLGRLGRWVSFPAGPVWFRYGVRNLARSKVISAMTLVAVALGLGLTISFFVTLTSTASTSLRATERDPWTALVDFFGPIRLEELDRIGEVQGVEKMIPYVKQPAQLVGNKESGTVYIVGVPPGSAARNPVILEGRNLQEGDERVAVIEKNMAERCQVRLGDRCRFQVQGKAFDAEVVGLLSGALPGESYVPLAMAQEMANLEGMCTGLFMVMGGDPYAVRRDLLALDNISQITLKPEIVELIRATIGEIEIILKIGAGFSIAIALLFMFCSVSFTVLQRKPEYVMLRILGFQNGTVATAIVVEVLVLGILSVLLAIPAGYESAVYLSARASRAWFHVQIVSELGDYLRILIPGLFLMPAAAIPAIRVILREPMEKSLRERRCG